MTTNNKKWELLNSEFVLYDKWIKVHKDKVQLPSGLVIDDFYVLDYPDWINVLAITENGKYIIEKQYRHAYGSVCTELCAGCVEVGETPLIAAKRELLEETGFGGGKWSLYMVTTANPAILNNRNFCFLAEGVKLIAETKRESTEDIEVLLLNKDEVLEILRRDGFQQSLMSALLWKYFFETTQK